MVVAPDLRLYRTDFAQVGTTARGCMKVIPSEQTKGKRKNLDRVAIGGENGCIICIARKNNDTQIIYKTTPGPAVSAVMLGGAIGTTPDKVFIASDNVVRGISKKGKTFFSIETNMAEPIRRMFIWGVELLITGRKSYSHFHDCADTNYFLSGDEVLDIVCLHEGGAWATRPFTAVLACADATLKVIEKSTMAYEIPLRDIPCTLALHMGDGGATKQYVLYGTKTGYIGLANIQPGDVKDQTRGVIWQINTSSISTITSLTYYPFMDGQRSDIVLGKEDGVVEIYNVADDDSISIVGTFAADESITSVSCGRVSHLSHDEIVVCTYTGWVFSLCKAPLVAPTTHPAANVNVKVQQLRSEIEELESKVNEERARYNEMTLRDGSTAAYIPHFQVHESFDYNPTYSAYTLVIELVLPIDYVVIKSSLPIRLMEVEKNCSVVSNIPKSEHSPWALLASYRCQAKTSRLELRARIAEGFSGAVHVYICPNIHPRAGVIRTFEVKPLSAHVRVHEFDKSRPNNTLAISGNFSLAEVHAWLVQLLVGVPAKGPTEDSATLNFLCAANGGTQLQIVYSRGSAIFRSDCISTIIIIRDMITAETNRRDLRVDVACDINEDSIAHCLRLMDVRMSVLIGIERKKMLASALKELEVNSGGDISFLSEVNKRILAEHDEIFAKAEEDSLEESNILAVYEALLVDRGRLAGKSLSGRVPALRELLEHNYSLEGVINFFKTTADEASLR